MDAKVAGRPAAASATRQVRIAIETTASGAIHSAVSPGTESPLAVNTMA